MNAIGKQLGVSGPAVYRYFRSRDELLTELVIDAYGDLATTLRTSIDRTPHRGRRRRLESLAHAYRAWAVAQPHRYRLLFGPPLPGYDAHADRLIAAASASMEVLVDSLPKRGDGPRLTKAPAEQLRAWAARHHIRVDAADALRAVLTWSRLHGFVSLEIAGNYASMGIDADALFATELGALPP